MNNSTTHIIDDQLRWAKTLTVDLPLAMTRWAVGMGTEEMATTTAWHGYDASVRVLTSAVDALYRAPITAVVFGRTVDAALRLQRLSNAVTGMVFAGFRRAATLPTTIASQEFNATTPQLAADIRKQQELQVVPQQRSVPASQIPAVRQPPHAPKRNARRRRRPDRQLSLPARPLAHQHRY